MAVDRISCSWERNVADLDDLDELRTQLRGVVRARGIDAVAADIPASRQTVFRLLTGRTARPTLAIRDGIERVIDDATLHLQRCSRRDH